MASKNILKKKLQHRASMKLFIFTLFVITTVSDAFLKHPSIYIKGRNLLEKDAHSRFQARHFRLKVAKSPVFNTNVQVLTTDDNFGYWGATVLLCIAYMACIACKSTLPMSMESIIRQGRSGDLFVFFLFHFIIYISKHYYFSFFRIRWRSREWSLRDY